MNDQLNLNNFEPEKEEDKEILPKLSFEDDIKTPIEGEISPSIEQYAPVFAENEAKSEQNDAAKNPDPTVEGFNSITPPITEEYYKFLEKKEIRHAATTIGFCFLASHLLILLLNLAYSVVGTIISFSFENGAAIISDPAVIHTIEIVWSIAIFLVPFIVMAKIRGYKISSLVQLEKPQKGDFIPFTLIGMGYCALSNMLISQVSSFFTVFEDIYNYKSHENPNGILGFIIAFLSVAIIPGLVEEFAVRGIVMGLIKRFGEGFAIIASALIFGLMHRNFIQIPFAFITGLGLGYIAVKTKTIWIAALVHAINNFVSLSSSYLGEVLGENTANILYAIYIAIALICGIVGIMLLSKRKDFYRFADVESKLTVKEKLYAVIFAPTVLIYSIICLFEAVSYFFK